MPETEQDLRDLARRRVGRKMGFYSHALVYVLVNLGLWAFATVVGRPTWHPGVLFGWGVGLAIHGVATFVGLHSDGLRQRMLDAEVERLRRR